MVSMSTLVSCFDAWSFLCSCPSPRRYPSPSLNPYKALCESGTKEASLLLEFIRILNLQPSSLFKQDSVTLQTPGRGDGKMVVHTTGSNASLVLFSTFWKKVTCLWPTKSSPESTYLFQLKFRLLSLASPSLPSLVHHSQRYVVTFGASVRS